MNVLFWWIDRLSRDDEPDLGEQEEWLPDDPLLAGD
jgi:hypothetical protein